MNHEVIERLIRNYAEDEDQAWEWLRGMHGMGGQLVASTTFDLAFAIADGKVIMPVVNRGAVVWVVCGQGMLRENVMRWVGDGKLVGLADPLTAARWWETEKSNEPQFPSPAHIAQPQWNQSGVAMPLPPVNQPMQVPGMPAFPPPVQPTTFSDPFAEAIAQRNAPTRPKPKHVI